MPVISLAGLVVVAQDALAGNNVGEAVLVFMAGSAYRRGNPPDAQLREGIVADLVAFMKQPFRTHVVKYSNIRPALSIVPTAISPEETNRQPLRGRPYPSLCHKPPAAPPRHCKQSTPTWQATRLDIRLIRSLGWQPRIALEAGLTDAHQWFTENAL